MNMPRSAPFMRLSIVLILATLSLGLTGCKSACRQLSERLCECALNSTDKSNCVARAGNAEGANPPTLDDEIFCKSHLSACDCRLIDTPRGKINCGLAKDPNEVIDAGR